MSIRLTLQVSQDAVGKLESYLAAHPELGKLVAPSPELRKFASTESAPHVRAAASGWLSAQGTEEFVVQEDHPSKGYWRDPVPASAITIYCFFMRDEALARRMYAKVDYPRDTFDFENCQSLLREVPEWRERLGELAVLSPQWTALTENWTRIENTLQNRGAAKASELIEQLIAVP